MSLSPGTPSISRGNGEKSTSDGELDNNGGHVPKQLTNDVVNEPNPGNNQSVPKENSGESAFNKLERPKKRENGFDRLGSVEFVDELYNNPGFAGIFIGYDPDNYVPENFNNQFTREILSEKLGCRFKATLVEHSRMIQERRQVGAAGELENDKNNAVVAIQTKYYTEIDHSVYIEDFKNFKFLTEEDMPGPTIFDSVELLDEFYRDDDSVFERLESFNPEAFTPERKKLHSLWMPPWLRRRYETTLSKYYHILKERHRLRTATEIQT